MLIPVNEETGHRVVSNSMLKSYGFESFGMDDAEQAVGCPAQFKARYVDRTVARTQSDPQRYGTTLHKTFELMETHGMSPDHALLEAFDIGLSTEKMEEAIADLENYMARESSPLERYGVLANEKHLETLLYVDDEYGPIYIQGYIDRISVDFDTPNLLHIGDWKAINQPPSVEDVKRSDQLKTYVYLVSQCYEELGLFTKPTVVVHLDAIKWFELPAVHFTDAQMEAWHARTVKLVRTILRDDEANPKLVWGCAYCPVRDACPEYKRTPDLALELLQVRPPVPLPKGDGPVEERVMPTEEEMRDYADDLASWAMRVNAARLLLDKQFKDVDARFKDDALRLGVIVAGGQRWEREQAYAWNTDLRTLHGLVDDPFYDSVTITDAALKELAAAHPDMADAILALRTKVPNGLKVTRKKA